MKNNQEEVTCKKCNETKSADKYYWTEDGTELALGYTCKECDRQRARRYYRSNEEQELQRARNYYRKNKKSVIDKLVKSSKLYPEKWKCRRHTLEAVRCGKLEKLSCEVCGEAKVQAHHTDYSKPLEVNWLCTKHHGEQHRKYATLATQ